MVLNSINRIYLRKSAWTSFNKPRHIQQGEDEQYFVYNAERQRVPQIVGSKRTVMLEAALGGTASFSVESDSDTGHKRYQHTVLAGGKPVASIIVNQEKSQPLRAENANYLHVDRMGSVVMVTDEAGRQQSKTVFDVWGLRRSVVQGAVTDSLAAVCLGRYQVGATADFRNPLAVVRDPKLAVL